MSQKDIDEVLTTIVDSPSSPILGGNAQAIETPPVSPDISCFGCGQKDHMNALL